MPNQLERIYSAITKGLLKNCKSMQWYGWSTNRSSGRYWNYNRNKLVFYRGFKTIHPGNLLKVTVLMVHQSLLDGVFRPDEDVMYYQLIIEDFLGRFKSAKVLNVYIDYEPGDKFYDDMKQLYEEIEALCQVPTTEEKMLTEGFNQLTSMFNAQVR